MKLERSKELFEIAKKYIPGGVNSPVRSFKSLDMEPIFMKKGTGSYVFDEDGNRYIDYVGSWGPLILGHLHPSVVSALEDSLKTGISFGAPTELENEMAKMLIDAVPGIDMVRMVNSGTEATMSALRLARAYTGRKKIIKFEGCYHGHADFLLIKAGSGALTHGVPTSPGVTEETAANTIVVPYNDISAVKEVINKEGAENIAAIILEPVAGNMGCIPPVSGFLESLRKITAEEGIVLIFDEVMCGFRVAYGGAQEIYGVTPDLTCLGKIIGAGLPVGAFGGKKEIMEQISPSGPVYQAGTLSGNPMAMSAGIAVLKELQRTGVYEELENKSSAVETGLKEAAEKAEISASVNRVGGMFSCFFSDKEVVNFEDVCGSSMEKFKVFYKTMLEEGIYLAPSLFESSFMSLAHSNVDIQNTIEASYNAFLKAKEA